MLVFGILVFLGIMAKALLRRIQLPSLVAFMVLGFLLRLTLHLCKTEIPGSKEILRFLSHVGVTCLLFRVGLDSDLRALIKRLRTASLMWLGNVLLSGGGGYLAARYVLHLDVAASMFVAVALTATSVGVSVATWRDQGALRTPNGELLVDVAELDDISGVVLMALLFAVGPHLLQAGASPTSAILGTLGVVMLKLTAFGCLCLLFSRYVEERMTDFCRELEHGPDPMLSMVAVALAIAAAAGILGFSVAIGAFFAGLVFSRDPDAVRMEASFEPLYELFTPFFFIHIGFLIRPDSLYSAAGIGGVVLLVAVVTKLVGTGLPALVSVPPTAAAVLGVSMVPRAEIAMVVMQRGAHIAEGLVSDDVYAAMVFVSALTCVGSPLLLRYLFRQWPEAVTDGESKPGVY